MARERRRTIGLAWLFAATLVGVAVTVLIGSGSDVTARRCSPIGDHPHLELCVVESAIRLTAPAAVFAVLLLGLAAVVGLLTAWRWRTTVRPTHDEPTDVRSNVLERVYRRRVRVLLVVAAWMPVAAGAWLRTRTESSFEPIEPVCTFGTDDGSVTWVCRSAVEVERRILSGSAWSVPLIMIGLAFVAGTLAWYFRALRIERHRRARARGHAL